MGEQSDVVAVVEIEVPQETCEEGTNNVAKDEEMIDVEWEKNETAEVKMSWKAGGDTETICSFLEVGRMAA
jgi:(p)ppGpp synthase/HD superfamily hydrolase